MRARYIEDRYISEFGKWAPDLMGLLECRGSRFLSMAWESKRAITVSIEALEDEDPDEDAPMRELDDVYTTRGWITQTYRWSISPEGITYRDHVIVPPEYEETEEWRRDLYREVMKRSVNLCANFPGQ